MNGIDILRTIKPCLEYKVTQFTQFKPSISIGVGSDQSAYLASTG